MDPDLLVIGPGGEVVYVDTTAITPGFNGTVSVVSIATESIDGGLTTTPLDFSGNQQITDSRDGTVVHLDSSAVRRTGTDDIKFPGTSSAFQTRIELCVLLQKSGILSKIEFQEALGYRMVELERVEAHLLAEVGTQSVTLERLQQQTDDVRLNQLVKNANTPNADMTAVAVELQEMLNLQEFTLGSVSRLLQPSLLQFLQQTRYFEKGRLMDERESGRQNWCLDQSQRKTPNPHMFDLPEIRLLIEQLEEPEFEYRTVARKRAAHLGLKRQVLVYVSFLLNSNELRILKPVHATVYLGIRRLHDLLDSLTEADDASKAG